MTFSLGECLFDLPANRDDRSARALEKPKLVPKSDYFAVFCGIHGVHLANVANVNEKRTNLKPLGVGVRPAWIY
jgi:hypothetical protein